MSVYGRGIIPIRASAISGRSDCLTFYSPNDFTLGVLDSTKHWDGTLEWSNDADDWSVWDGTTTISSYNGYLYLRGIGNTVITGMESVGATNQIMTAWVLSGENIICTGNIETLLDYSVVSGGEHPIMGPGCYLAMFSGCTSLITAPELPATTLADYCYYYMFDGCTSLTTAPELPATTLGSYCYSYMFRGCTSLTTAPELPATTLGSYCYLYMFRGCTSLTTAPELPATTLTVYCYKSMFSGCTSLITAPELPAIKLRASCYEQMFLDCTSLTTAPELPATTLDSYCCSSMFSGCVGLKLSTTEGNGYIYPYRIPVSGTGVILTGASGVMNNMFAHTGGTFQGTPEINTVYYMTTQPV